MEQSITLVYGARKLLALSIGICNLRTHVIGIRNDPKITRASYTNFFSYFRNVMIFHLRLLVLSRGLLSEDELGKRCRTQLSKMMRVSLKFEHDSLANSTFIQTNLHLKNISSKMT